MISYVNSTSANTGNSAANSLQISTPSSIVAGNGLIATIATDGAPTITPPSGWTLLTAINQSSNVQLAVYWRLATGTEGANYTWSFSASEQASGTIVQYSGVSGFQPNTWSTITGTSATTLPMPSINSQENGQFISCWATRNTTAASTITAASGNTGRVDTCTTAADFIEAEVQDKAAAFPIGGVGTQNSTASQTALNYAGIILYLDGAHVTNPLILDQFNGSGLSAVSTLAQIITTNYANELLIACSLSETGSNTVSSVSGGGLTWNKLGSISTQGGDLELWYALAASTIFRQTITFNWSGNVTGEALIFGIAGIDTTSGTGSSAFGATQTANSAGSSTPSASLNTTRNNSWVFALENSSNSTAGNSSGTGQTVIKNHSSTGSSCILMQNGATPTSGTNVTMSTNVATTDWNMFAFEVLPALAASAASHVGLPLLGVG